MLVKEGNTADALKFYKKALRLDPDSAILYAESGRLYMRSGQYEKAKKNMEKAIELAPEHSNTHVNMAELLLIDERKLQGGGQL